MPILGYRNYFPTFPRKTCFVSENATLCGDVTLEDECSIWFGAVLRADSAPIRIGRGSNVQDNSVIHTDSDFPVRIEQGVTIGHACVIHGASLSSNILVGMRSILLNGSRIGSNCVIAAGSLVTQNTEIPEGSLVMGSPAVVKRKLSEEEIQRIMVNAEHYRNFRAEYLKAGKSSI